jgi:V8-like Glu-specific endopeptidase
MAEVLETVSEKPVGVSGEMESQLPVASIAGNPGAAAPDSGGGDGIIVSGTREEPLSSPVRRIGVETVIGVDERTLITDTSGHPWRMIAALRLTPRPPSTGSYIGTAWFIGRRTLLTAGHCVYSDTDFGGWIGSIEASPGRNGQQFPFGSFKATRFSTLEKWKNTSDPDFDVGCIHLEEPVGDQVGWFSIAALSDTELANQLLNVSGYPGDRGNGTEQYHHANRVLHPAARRIYYDIDTYGGQSGSPVWKQGSNGDPVAVGIHAYGLGGTSSSLNITANSAPRITPLLLDTIRGWLADDDR